MPAFFLIRTMYIIETLFPIVAIAFLAWLAARHQIVSDPEVQALEKLTFTWLVPCMLFYGTATADLPDVMDWDLLWSYYLAILAVYLGGMLIARLRFGPGQVRHSVIGMGCAYPNVTILGIPICLELLGEAAFVPMFMLISLNNLLILSFGTVLAELKREEGSAVRAHLAKIGAGLVKNPISGSLIAGILVNLAGIPIYGPLLESLELLSRAAIPAALLTLGAGLNRYRVKGEITMALVLTGMKLLVLPGLVWFLAFFVFDLDILWARTAVLLACMPVGITVYVFSIRYRNCENLVATAIVLSCMLSVFSISFYAFLLGI
jgi:malonate transporter